MRIYKVGEVVCSPSADMVQFDLADDAATLLIKMGEPTAKEKKSFANPFPFRFAVVEDIIFVMVRINDMWLDAPYNKGLSRDLSELPDVPDGEGLAIHALLVDANTGILVNQKLFSPTTDTSRILVDAVRKQPEIQDYAARLQSVYARYTTNALVSISQRQY